MELNTPHTPYAGLIARAAIQCDCPDTKETGSFLFSGESHRNKGSRVTPVFPGLAELYAYLKKEWEPIGGSAGEYIFHPAA